MKTKFSIMRLILSSIIAVALLSVIYSCTKEDEVIPAPTIVSISPESGAEGATIFITGSYFSTVPADNVVKFDDLVAVVTDATSTQLTVVVPKGAETGEISVSVNGKLVTSETSFKVTSVSQLVNEAGGVVSGKDGIISVTLPPGSVAEGTTVSILETEETAPNGIGKVYTLSPEGTQFAKPVKLSFHYTDEDAAITPPSSMAIGYKKSDNTWEVMPVIAIDQNAKTITTETTHFSQWTLLEVPTISGFSPASGKAGAIITITGSNFSSVPSENTVIFNNKLAVVLSATATALTAKVPVDATSGRVIVTTKFNGLDYVTTSPTDFIVESSVPEITAFQPASGVVGATITITGKNFSGVAAENTVMFNGTPAVVISSTTSVLVVNIPVGATSGRVMIMAPSNGISYTGTSSSDFIVESNEPLITGFTPAHAKVGATITITGKNFSAINAENTVTFNSGKTAEVISSTSTAITVTVPAGATSGKVLLITMFNGFPYTAVSGSNFTVDPDEPSVSGFTPDHGTAGATITITGSNFSSTASENKVFFNGVEATVVSSSATALTVIVPSGATSGKVMITTMYNGINWTETSPGDFTID